jgi:two-component system chemotaxis response regulator CheB
MLTAAVHPAPVRLFVVGGSAGSIDALAVVLPSLPAAFPVPVVIVVHLPPGHPSLLPQVFASRCALPVTEPEDKQPVGPGIWFAPSDYHLLVERDHTFSLSIDAPVRWSRPSIDVLFHSAAEAYGRELGAVVLSGANEDGAAGAAAIHRAGGLVLVQDPATAEAPEMPRAAIRVASPRRVFAPADLSSLLCAVTMEHHR